jgi:transaldolase
LARHLSRELLETGAFAELVRDYAVTGATSNRTIFAKGRSPTPRPPKGRGDATGP